MLSNRALPNDMMKYRLAIQLYKIYNGFIINGRWIDMSLQQNFNARQMMVQVTDVSNIKVGKNILMNRLTVINNENDYNWLNLSLISYNLNCKSVFLSKLQLQTN